MEMIQKMLLWSRKRVWEWFFQLRKLVLGAWKSVILAELKAKRWIHIMCTCTSKTVVICPQL